MKGNVSFDGLVFVRSTLPKYIGTVLKHLETTAIRLGDWLVAERVGFEPTVPITRNTRFPGAPDRPLQHLSTEIINACYCSP